jgi:crotonobetainyl-CoA:carnitine CoA-transferase CaiB-like acyl-CoA transferase
VSKRAFEGVRIADFSWAGVGILTTRYLAHHGAEVIKIETQTRVDITRVYGPYKDGVPGIDRCLLFGVYNSSRRSVTLNLNHPKGPEVAKRLVAWADIVVENFAPGVMDRWGLGYDQLRKVKSDIIMCSTCMQGQTGPHRGHPGYGLQLSGLAGYVHLLGWPDRPPAIPYGAYTDFIVPPLAAAAIIAALDYRRRTGKGQYIDVSQFEAGIQLLAPLLLDYAVNGRIAGRVGNRSACTAPHGVYRCSGDDRWCAIAVFTDEEWSSFCRVLGNPDWAKQERFGTPMGRKRNEEELDILIEEWTSNYSAEEVMARMQQAGIASGVVETTEDLYADPQLAHRGYFHQVEHPELGSYYAQTPPFKLSETPYEIGPAPTIGQDNEYVFTQLMGMSDEEFIELDNEGVFK